MTNDIGLFAPAPAVVVELDLPAGQFAHDGILPARQLDRQTTGFACEHPMLADKRRGELEASTRGADRL
jgi:hypothetical protein